MITLAMDLRPDLVLMNIELPRTDGISATMTLTARRVAAVLMFTGTGEPETFVQRARDAGAMTVVQKPFATAHLASSDRDVHRPLRRNRRTAGSVADLTQRLQASKIVERAQGAEEVLRHPQLGC